MGSVLAACMWDLLSPETEPVSQVSRQILNRWITRVAQNIATFYFEFSLTQTIDANHSSHITVSELAKFKAQRGSGGISCPSPLKVFLPGTLTARES